MILLTIPRNVVIREGQILAVPELPAQAAQRRRELAALAEPSAVQAFHSSMRDRIAAARAARGRP